MTEQPPTDRRGIEVMTRAACEDRLASASVGRIAVQVAGDPLIVPVVYRFHRGAVVFKTAAGEKLDVISMNAPAAFQIDDWDVDTHTGWSVLVRGRTEPVYDEEAVSELDGLGLQAWVPDRQPTTWVRILPTDISGRIIG